MRGSSAREARKAAKETVQMLDRAISPVLSAQQQHGFGLAARITALEGRANACGLTFDAFRGRTFARRLRWLLLGR